MEDNIVMTDNNAHMGLEALAESLNGWEELAVQKAFGFSIDEFENHGTLGIRALAFVEIRREDSETLPSAKDAKAYKAAMDLSLRDLVDRYPEMSEDPDEVVNPMKGIEDAEGKA